MEPMIHPQMPTPKENEWMSRLRGIVLDHIDSDRFAVFVYGSRASHTAVRSSDVDIGIWGEERLPSVLLARIREAIDESDIPFHYDIVDFSMVDESFRAIALQHIIPWNQPTYFTKKLQS